MHKTLIAIVWSSLLAALPAAAADQENQEKAPLVLASGQGPRIEFQIGADAFAGLGLGGADFIGGVNASLTYPVLDLLWVGIRPALHYVMLDEPYDATWMHADALVQVNALHAPVRLYGLVAGGYSFALDTDIYAGAAHGFSVLAGAGVAWQPADFPVGLFAELTFRYGLASRGKTQLVRDAEGEPIYDAETLTWQTEEVTQDFELLALTVNLGLTISP
ncbi:MAG: hypothetical protein JXR96_06275 [Deltaproteobacteria bacterium]|nr:hypothetical protein [Deltaproteobacteria bacterium]